MLRLAAPLLLLRGDELPRARLDADLRVAAPFRPAGFLVRAAEAALRPVRFAAGRFDAAFRVAALRTVAFFADDFAVREDEDAFAVAPFPPVVLPVARVEAAERGVDVTGGGVVIAAGPVSWSSNRLAPVEPNADSELDVPAIAAFSRLALVDPFGLP